MGGDPVRSDPGRLDLRQELRSAPLAGTKVIRLASGAQARRWTRNERWVDRDGGARSDWPLPDLVEPVEAGACDDVALHGGGHVVERENGGQGEVLVEGEQLEHVGVRPV